MENLWRSIPLDDRAKVTGKLLGDGGIMKQRGRKPRFQFTHSTRDQEWSFYCYKELSDVLPLNEPKFNRIIDPRLTKGFSERVICQSKTSSLISFLHNQWYKTQKIIPFNLLQGSLTPRALAWWYQDDGYLKIVNQVPQKIVLSTECFTLYECQQLINIILQKFKLKFSLDGQRRLVLYDHASIRYFLYLVRPHTVPCMHRKLACVKVNLDIAQPRRTTISLPVRYSLSKPTAEINEALYYTKDMYRQLADMSFYRLYSNNLKTTEESMNGYQIVISATNLAYMNVLKKNTGLTYNQLALLCFMKKKETSK